MKGKLTIIDKLKNSAIIMLLPVLLYFFVGPLSVYCSNSQDFMFYYDDFFWSIGIVGVCIYIIGTLLISILPKKIYELMLTSVFYIGVMSYIQDLLLNIKLSENDGSALKWEELKGFTIVDTLIWVAVLAIVIVVAIKTKEKNNKLFVYISGFISLIQLVVIVTLLITAVSVANAAKNTPVYDIVGQGQYEVASKENIIVFVLDSYGNTQLDDGLKNNPDLLNPLHDFTYYNNSDSAYYGTFPSMVHMITGQEMDLEAGPGEYLDKAWNSENTKNYFNVIKNAGYKYRLYSANGKPVYGNAANFKDYIDNVKELTINIDKKAVLIRMAKISVFKYLPYILKPYFEVPSYMFYSVHNYGDYFVPNSGNMNFYGALKEKGLTIDDSMENAIIIQHLDGTHLPNNMAADGSYDENGTLQSTEEGLMLILDEYMSYLKDIGMYDNSTIIITADHGRWSVFEEGDDPQVIFFIKRAGEHRDVFEINEAPISHKDFPATILDIIGEDYSEFGTSIFMYNPGDTRERTYVNKKATDLYPDTPGDAFNTYEVYTYTGTKEDIRKKSMTNSPDATYRIIGW